MKLGHRLPVVAVFLLAFMGGRAAWSDATPSGFGEVDAYLSGQMRRVGVPGVAVTVVCGGRTLHLKGYGTAGPDAEVSAQTPFDLASVTKSFTALAVMQLVEQGKIDLDKSVRTYLPWFRLADEEAAATITVRQLLTHTSGISSLAGRQALLSREVGPEALERGVRALAVERPTARPGERFQYSNANYAVAAVVVATVSGTPFHRHVEELIFEPLGMRNSFTFEADGLSHGMATGHRQWFGHPVAAPGLPYTHADLGAGGLFASAEDLARYMTCLLNGGELDGKRVLSAHGVEELFRPVVELRPDLHYALGWFVRERTGERIVYHGGDNPHFHADLILAPAEGIGVAVLMNANSPVVSRRLGLVSQNVMALVRGEELVATPRDPVLTGILFTPPAILVIQAILAFRGLRNIRRWTPETRPPWRGIGFSIAANLVLAAILLLGVPVLFQIPLSALFVLAPDFAWPVALSAGFALAWAATQTVLAIMRHRALRRNGLDNEIAGNPVA